MNGKVGGRRGYFERNVDGDTELYFLGEKWCVGNEFDWMFNRLPACKMKNKV